MTQINKFAGYGIAVAAALAVAMALLVSTAYADVTAIAVDVADPDVGDTVTITVSTDGASEAVHIDIHPNSVGAVEFAGGADSATVTTSGGLVDVEVEATEAGVVVLRAQQVDADDDPTETIAITVGGAPSEVASLALATPGALGDGDIANGSVRALTSEGDGVGGETVTVVIGGAGTLHATGGVCDVAADAPTTAVTECTVDTASSPASVLGIAQFAIEATGDPGDEISILTFTGTRSANATVTIGGVDAETVTVAGSASETGGEVDTITVTALDEDGNPVPDGTAVSVGVSAGVAFACTTTVNGVATCSYTPPGVAQTVTAVATVTGTTGTTTFEAGGEVVGDGSFTGTIPSSGVALVTFNGGTVAQLAAAAQAEGVLSVSATVGGEFIVYIVGAPAFVNAEFNSTFSAGLEAGTPVILYIPAS
ncbi:MAG: hypothetical protein GEU80_16515 [Dehalococcoidia bacterium]|nr:hypothetical protein [Dehalococcoidia bacterium]